MSYTSIFTGLLCERSTISSSVPRWISAQPLAEKSYNIELQINVDKYLATSKCRSARKSLISILLERFPSGRNFEQVAGKNRGSITEVILIPMEMKSMESAGLKKNCFSRTQQVSSGKAEYECDFTNDDTLYCSL